MVTIAATLGVRAVELCTAQRTCYDEPPGQPPASADESIVCRGIVRSGVSNDLNEPVSGETPNWPEMRIEDLKREVVPHLAFE